MRMLRSFSISASASLRARSAALHMQKDQLSFIRCCAWILLVSNKHYTKAHIATTYRKPAPPWTVRGSATHQLQFISLAQCNVPV